jgi:hypothetical protein
VWPPLVPLPTPENSKLFVSSTSVLVLSYSSFRQASSHYRHNLFKSSTAFSPHSSVLPTTTSASSSDLRPRNYVKVPWPFPQRYHCKAYTHRWRRIHMWDALSNSGLRIYSTAAGTPTIKSHDQVSQLFPQSLICIFGPQVLDHAPHGCCSISPSHSRYSICYSSQAVLGKHSCTPLLLAPLHSSLFALCC